MIVRQLVVSYVLLVAIAIAGFTVPVAFILSAQLHGDTRDTALREARTAVRLLSLEDTPHREALASLIVAYQRETPGRMDVLLPGRLAATPLSLPVAADDPAFSAALAGREWQRWGYARALRADGLVVALPARDDAGQVVGAVRLSYPSAPLNERTRQIWTYRAGLALAVLVIAAALGFLIARRLTLPLRRLNAMAVRLQDGDLTTRAEETGPTEIRTLAHSLNLATQTIDGLVRSQRALIADSSHQLFTPLTALRLSLDNVADMVDDPATRDDVERAIAEVIRMTHLVNGLLSLARAEAAGAAPDLAVTPVRIAEVVSERFEAWQAAAYERGIRLRLRPGGSDLMAVAARGHLEQILDNVLSNALDFSPDGGTVTAAIRRLDQGVELTVSDEGPGIRAAELERAFDRFWRAPDAGQRTGSGLGLAIIKQLVIDNDGTVTLEAGPSGGLTVRITLPAG